MPSSQWSISSNISSVRRCFTYVCFLSNHGRLARWHTWKSCDVGEAKEGLENELWRREATEGLENELWRRWSDWKLGEWAHSPSFVTSPTSQLILQPFPRFTYVTAHSPTLPLLPYVTAHSPILLSLLLHHRIFSYVTWRAAHGTQLTS